MHGVGVKSGVDLFGAAIQARPPGGAIPLQVAPVLEALNQPWWLRGGAAFAMVVVLGAVMQLRFGPVVDRSVEFSTDRPFAALMYGVGTHFVILFAGLYIMNQLRYVTISGYSGELLGPIAGLLLLGTVGAVGFTVAGSALLELLGESNQWYGLLIGALIAALIAGVAALIDLRIGALVWILIVSMAIGGPIRVWVHAAEDVNS